MKDTLEEFLNWKYGEWEQDSIFHLEENRSDKKIHIIFKDEEDEEEYIYEIIGEKLFENAFKRKYYVSFIKEKFKYNENNETEDLNIFSFINVSEEKYIGLEYNIEHDDYGIKDFNYVYAYTKDITYESNYLDEQLRNELKDIFKQSYDYIELNQKKKILRLLDLEQKEESIRHIKYFI